MSNTHEMYRSENNIISYDVREIAKKCINDMYPIMEKSADMNHDECLSMIYDMIGKNVQKYIEDNDINDGTSDHYITSLTKQETLNIIYVISYITIMSQQFGELLEQSYDLHRSVDTITSGLTDDYDIESLKELTVSISACRHNMIDIRYNLAETLSNDNAYQIMHKMPEGITKRDVYTYILLCNELIHSFGEQLTLLKAQMSNM